MRLFLFLPLIFSATAFAGTGPDRNIQLCGFHAEHFLASKMLFSYAALLNPEFAAGEAKPEYCAEAIRELSALPERSPGQDVLLGVAATGYLATTLRNVVDKDGDLRIDESFDPGDPASTPDKAILWIFNAQDEFIKYGGLTGRADVKDTVRLVTEECLKSTPTACGGEPGEINAATVLKMRGLLKTLLFPEPGA